MGYIHTPKVLNGLSDRVLSHWFPTGKSSHAYVDRKTGRRGRGGAQPNENMI